MKDLFEPPFQYEEMKRKLERHKVLLILGEPHLGKTYTALNLLYDYYVKGLHPIFRSELDIEKVQREIMYEWEKLLKPNTVIYFEDPFGKTEPKNAQVFRSELERIIGRIQNSESMVIMTSRLNVFKEIGDPDDFPMIVELMKGDISYDAEKRKRIIDNYVGVYDPVWRKLLNVEVDGGTLKEYIAGELTEPHNIGMFFEKSQKIEDMNLLLEKVKESKEILKVFKKEIEKSSIVERIFFYSCYIFERKWNGLKIFERKYPDIIEEFRFDLYENGLDNLLRKYDFRVETYEGIFGLEIKFSHPDFSRAVGESFSENSGIIGKILFKLVKDENSVVREIIAETIGYNFEKLPEEYRKILFELVKDEDSYVRGTVAETIGYNFEKLPEEYRKILFELVEDENSYVREIVAITIAQNFEKLPEQYRKILFELVEDGDSDVRDTVAGTIRHHFEKIPEEYRKLLLVLSDDVATSVRITVALTISSHFEELSEEYQKTLKKFKSDIPVITSLKIWIKESERYGLHTKTMETLKREWDL